MPTARENCRQEKTHRKDSGPAPTTCNVAWSRRMSNRFLFALPVVLLGCGSLPKTSGTDLVLTISSPLGDLAYSCEGGGIVQDTYSTAGVTDMLVICYPNTAGSDAGTFVGSAQLEVGQYHGADTYVFQCDGGYAGTTCSNGEGNHAWFPLLGDYDLIAWPASPGFPSASCSVTVDGPSTLSLGDHVSGIFECDPIQAVFKGATTASSPPAELTTSVTGQFDGTVR
jgi:hypothetical protein